MGKDFSHNQPPWPVWRSMKLSLKTKMWFHNSNALSTFLCSWETWWIKTSQGNQFDAFGSKKNNSGYRLDWLHYKWQSQHSSQRRPGIFHHHPCHLCCKTFAWQTCQQSASAETSGAKVKKMPKDDLGSNDRWGFSIKFNTRGSDALYEWLQTKPTGVLWLPHASHDVGANLSESLQD